LLLQQHLRLQEHHVFEEQAVHKLLEVVYMLLGLELGHRLYTQKLQAVYQLLELENKLCSQ